MITAYTLIYTSLLIISGCLQLAEASTSHVLGPAEGSSTVSTPPVLTPSVVPTPSGHPMSSRQCPGPPQSTADGWLRPSRQVWEQKSDAAEVETVFSHQASVVNKHTSHPQLLDFLFSLKHLLLKNHSRRASFQQQAAVLFCFYRFQPQLVGFGNSITAPALLLTETSYLQ